MTKLSWILKKGGKGLLCWQVKSFLPHGQTQSFCVGRQCSELFADSAPMGFVWSHRSPSDSIHTAAHMLTVAAMHVHSKHACICVVCINQNQLLPCWAEANTKTRTSLLSISIKYPQHSYTATPLIFCSVTLLTVATIIHFSEALH